LGLVGLELYRPFEELAQACQDPLIGRSASNVDVPVVSVAAEGMAAAFQFPVKIRQQDVR